MEQHFHHLSLSHALSVLPPHGSLVNNFCELLFQMPQFSLYPTPTALDLAIILSHVAYSNSFCNHSPGLHFIDYS